MKFSSTLPALCLVTQFLFAPAQAQAAKTYRFQCFNRDVANPTGTAASATLALDLTLKTAAETAIARLTVRHQADTDKAPNRKLNQGESLILRYPSADQKNTWRDLDPFSPYLFLSGVNLAGSPTELYFKRNEFGQNPLPVTWRILAVPGTSMSMPQVVGGTLSCWAK